ncbi:zinc finger CCCH domain-containing protein 11A isoform X2 [Dendropsophus ebraccatus]|uniref:zinc finger CCCH domain-containing protein 11A isoform X2 n=1 Tax=Dendropsophus ebraccatus TaxID=150705 RepID=UPI0038320607
MSNQGDDCYFYFYSTCTKGDSCAFRHSEAALGNETVCTLWQEGRCFRQICKFRHMEIDKKRSEIPCYWENQLSGCQKVNCAFHHTKGRFVDGTYFPPSKVTEKPESCQQDVQSPVPSPAPSKISVAPTQQLRGVKKMEATENVPSPTHPPVVINAADDDEDDDDQFSEEGEELKSSALHSAAPGNQHGAHGLSTRKTLMPRKDYSVSPEIFASPYNQVDDLITDLRTAKLTSKAPTAHLTLAQRLGKRKNFPGDSPLAAARDVLPPAKRTLSKRLGKRMTSPPDSPEGQPKPAAYTVSDFRIKTLEEIRQEKASQSVKQETSPPSLCDDSKKSKISSKPHPAIHIKSLSEIREEKRLRQLTDENAKDERDGKADKEPEETISGSTTECETIPAETAPKQTGISRNVQAGRKMKLPIVNDSAPSHVRTAKPTAEGTKHSSHSIEKVKVKTLEEIRQEKALRLQQTAKSAIVDSVCKVQASSNHRKILRLPRPQGKTDGKVEKLPAEVGLAGEEDKTSLTVPCPVTTSGKQNHESVDTKTESQTPPGRLPTPERLKDKPKLNVEPCVLHNAPSIRAAGKQKAQERTIVAEVKPMSCSVAASDVQKASGKVPVIESLAETSLDNVPPKRRRISSQADSPLPSASATVQPPLKLPRTSTAAAAGKSSAPAEDEFDELMWDISDDKLEVELDLDSNKDEDALLLELSKMIDS